METKEGKSSYGKPPWIFKGSALYQLHLVKTEVAQAFIPKELRLVEAFGYTLGGFFLASYDDSPVGRFDELVVIAGTVWNPPTSCAWASRVLVNSKEACDHGRKDVGLPSQVAHFKKHSTSIVQWKTSLFTWRIVGLERRENSFVSISCLSEFENNSTTPNFVWKHFIVSLVPNIMAIPRKQSESKISKYLNIFATGDHLGHPDNCMDIHVTEINASSSKDMCLIRMGSSDLDHKKRTGPTIKMSLPSFSGHTPWNHHLLKYSCQIECRIRLAKSAKVTGPVPILIEEEADGEENSRKLSISVLLSKPVLALEFNCLKMQVEEPVVISPSPNTSIVQSS